MAQTLNRKPEDIRPLFLLLSSEFGEDEQLACEDIYELNALGIVWRAVCLKDSPVYSSLIQAGPSKVIAVDRLPRVLFDDGLKRLLREQMMDQINLLHVFGSDHLGSILPWMIAFPSVPVIITESPSVRKKLRHSIQALFYGRIDVLLVASQSLRRTIQVMRPALEKKVKVVGPGLDLHIFNPDHFDFSVLRKKWNVSNEDYLVGMIATPDYPKAQSAFIRAAASFLRNEELASRTKFVIVGFDEEGSGELIDLISAFHLQDKILLMPAESSIPKILGTLDVYVIPSSKATYGLQAIESLAMGTPIICASGPDSAEWIGDSRAGLLMRSGDSFDLQRNLRLMLEDPRELKAMGKRGVDYARAHYDRAKRTDRLVEIYQRRTRLRNRA